MLMVAPRGSTVEATMGLMPRFSSATDMDTGSVAELDEVEKVQFYQLLNQMVLNYKDILDAYDKGLFDFPTYEAWQGFICAHLVMPGGKLWWQDHEQSFIPRVREELNQGMLEVPRLDATSNAFWSSDAHIEILKENPERLTSRKPSDT